MSSSTSLASRRSLALLIMTLVACVYLLSISKPAQADEHMFKDKVAIITGTSFGLGRELALLAAAKEMKLVMVDIRPEPSQELAEQLRSQGVSAIVMEVDLAEADQRPQIIERTLEEFGQIDYLFNNAGYSYLATLEEMDMDEAKRLMEVNYWAYADLAQRVIPHMREQGGGTILNVSSILGTRAAGGNMGHYAATKHALHGLFQSTAQEVAEDNIRVFVAAPAGMRTQISRHSVGPAANPEVDRAADWEDPAIPARDIFDMIRGDDVVFLPGYIGRQ